MSTGSNDKEIVEVVCPTCGPVSVRADCFSCVKHPKLVGVLQTIPTSGWCRGCDRRLIFADGSGRPCSPWLGPPPSHPTPAQREADAQLKKEADDWLYGVVETSERFPKPHQGEVKTIGVSVQDGVIYHPSLCPDDVAKYDLKVKIGER